MWEVPGGQFRGIYVEPEAQAPQLMVPEPNRSDQVNIRIIFLDIFGPVQFLYLPTFTLVSILPSNSDQVPGIQPKSGPVPENRRQIRNERKIWPKREMDRSQNLINMGNPRRVFTWSMSV